MTKEKLPINLFHLIVKGEEVTMLWGKFKGKKISEIPSSYLKYVAENWEEDTSQKKVIVIACDEEWQYREKYNCHIDDGGVK